MIAERRKIFSRLIGAGAITFLGAGRSLAVQYQAVIPCSHCGTGFRVEWNGTETVIQLINAPNAARCPVSTGTVRVFRKLKRHERVFRGSLISNRFARNVTVGV